MKILRELCMLIYETIIVVLSVFFYGVFLCIWGITYPLYWIIRLFKSLCKEEKKEIKSVVVSGAGSGMGQMLCVQYAKRV